MVLDLTERLFAGNAAELVNHLLTEQDIDPKELAQITRMLAERKDQGGER